MELDKISKIAKQILLGLSYLNYKGIVHRSLSPSNILFDKEENVKLFNYGLYYMSNYNKCVSFPIGSPKYMAPEIFLNMDKTQSGPKVDVWSVGIILAELALNKDFWCDLKLNQVIKRILSLIICSGTVLEHIANEHGCSDIYKSLPLNFKNFINLCLTVEPSNRPTPTQLLENEFFSNNEEVIENLEGGYHIDFLKRVSMENNNLNGYHKNKKNKTSVAGLIESQEDLKVAVIELSKRRLKEIYHLWQLAGGDVYSELKKQGMIKNKPPTLSLPK